MSADRVLPRAFWAIWAGQFINRLTGFVQPFLVLYLTGERSLSVATAGLVVSAVGIGACAAHLIGGVLADRVGRRITLLISFFGMSIAMALLGTASSLSMIVLCSLVVGVTAELFRPAAAATVADLVPSDGRVRAYGLLFWAINLGFALSTSMAGFLAGRGFGLLFWLDALGSAMAGVIIWRIVPETRPAPASGKSRSLLRVAARDRLLVLLFLIGIGIACLYLQAYSTLPLSMAADGLAPSVYGIVIALNGVVIVLVQPFAIRFLASYDKNRVLALSMLVVGLGFGLGALVSEPIGYGASVVIWSIGEIGFSAVAMAMFADLAPEDLRGGYLGIGALTYSLGAVIGPLAGTFVLSHSGPEVLWTGCAAIGVVVFLAQLALGPALRHRASASANQAVLADAR